MRVLVTGHHGYIGRIVAPLLGAGGHEVAGLDAGCSRAAPRPRRRDVPGCASTCATSRPDDLAGFDAVVHLAALSNDPLGDLNGTAPRHQPPRRRCGWRELARRPASAASCSPRRAASTARPATQLLDETAPLQPGDRLRRVEGRCRARRRPLADDDFQPDLPAQRHRLRRLAAAARRHRGEQPRRRRATRRRGADHERRHALAAARARRRTSRARSWPCWRRRATSCTTRRSTSGATARTTRSATSPRSSHGVVPGSASVPEGGRRRTALLPRRLRQAAQRCFRISPRMGRARRGRRAPERLPALRAHARGVHRAVLHAAACASAS